MKYILVGIGKGIYGDAGIALTTSNLWKVEGDGKVSPSDLNQEGATSGQAIIWNGFKYVPSLPVNDSRYLRKDVADSRTGTFTQNGNQVIAGELSFDRLLGNCYFIFDSAISGGVYPFQLKQGGVLYYGFDLASNSIRQNKRLSIVNGVLSSGPETMGVDPATGIVFHGKGTVATHSARMDQLPLNPQQSISTSGIVNNIALSDMTKIASFTAATELTGLSTTYNDRLIRIYNGTGGVLVIKDESVLSIAANRFSMGADYNLPNLRFSTFIYANSRWRISD